MLTLFIYLWAILSAFLAYTAFSKIKLNKQACDFTWWWAFPWGAFVWEDLMVFGALHALISFISIYIGNNLIWVIFILVFWIIRSAGETLYFFLQQFIVPTHHPHAISDHFKMLRSLFGNISDQKCFIILQVCMQSILVLSLLGLILVLHQFTW